MVPPSEAGQIGVALETEPQKERFHPPALEAMLGGAPSNPAETRGWEAAASPAPLRHDEPLRMSPAAQVRTLLRMYRRCAAARSSPLRVLPQQKGHEQNKCLAPSKAPGIGKFAARQWVTGWTKPWNMVRGSQARRHGWRLLGSEPPCAQRHAGSRCYDRRTTLPHQDWGNAPSGLPGSAGGAATGPNSRECHSTA